MKVNLTDSKKRKHKYPVGFSYGYFFLGPVYLLFRRRFLASILLLLLYYLFLPIPGLKELSDILNGPNWLKELFTLFSSKYFIWCGILLISILHIVLSIVINKVILSKDIDKKFLLPSSDKDASILANYIRKYSDLPVHPSYVKKITFIDDNSDTTIAKLNTIKEDKRFAIAQNQLDIIYEKYESGFISQKELFEKQREIIKNINEYNKKN